MEIVSKAMNSIDLAILDFTEWFCRKCQLLTGRTNVWFAIQLTNLSIVVSFAWAGVLLEERRRRTGCPSACSAASCSTR